MKVKITGDTYHDSGLSEWILDVSEPCEDYFSSRNYGEGLIYFGVVLMCLPADYGLKQRINRSIKKSSLFMDVVLNYEAMKNSTRLIRRDVVASALKNDVSRVLKVRRIDHFDVDAFLCDWTEWIGSWARKSS
jgi:hypothetical protein